MNSIEADSALLSIDPEAVTDEPENSVLAFLDIFIATIGLLAIVEPWIVPVAIVAVILGAVILIFAKSWLLATLSTTLAKASIVLGVLSASSGISQQQIETSRRESMAREVASEYVNSIASGNMAMAIKMSGLPPMVQEEEATTQGNELAREQQAIRRFLNDPGISAIRKRGKDGEWQAKEIVYHSRYGDTTTLTIHVYDKNQLNQIPYAVTTEMRTPGKYAPDNKIRWIVTSVDVAKL